MANLSQRKHIAFVLLVDLIPNEATAQYKFENIRFPDGKLRCHRVPMPIGASTLRCLAAVVLANGTSASRPERPCNRANCRYGQGYGPCFLELISPRRISAAPQYLTTYGVVYATPDLKPFKGPAEADASFIGGVEKNKHAHKKLRAGREGVGKMIVWGTAQPVIFTLW